MALTVERCGHGIRALDVAVDHGDVQPVGSERRTDGSTDAAGPAGNDGNAPIRLMVHHDALPLGPASTHPLLCG
jgi:hypothetical protein